MQRDLIAPTALAGAVQQRLVIAGREAGFRTIRIEYLVGGEE